MLVAPNTPDAYPIGEQQLSTPSHNPREAMAARLPRFVQPLLTWITARPAPGEVMPERSPLAYVWGAIACIVAGVGLSLLPFLLPSTPLAAWFLIPLGLTFTCCGLGLFQVVVFHHCSHRTVFANLERNRQVGRLISAALLFQRFDDYQRSHMTHHSPKKLLTDEDEFHDFVLGLMRLEAGMTKQALWRRLLWNVVSPRFHGVFLAKRIQKSMFSGDREHDWMARGIWAALILAALTSGNFGLFLLAWVLPVTLLLQIATIGRIVIEHTWPDAHHFANRGRDFSTYATFGVFPGSMPPVERANTLRGLLAWSAWWAEMLTWQVFVRLFVMVGDAPCHDYHHRKPASKNWTVYTHAREADLETNLAEGLVVYQEVWGLITAIDRNMEALAATAPETLGHGTASATAPGREALA